MTSRTRRPPCAAAARRLLWRSGFTVTGGLRVTGPLPAGACVVVANHSSHADAPALLAALPAACRPVVAAARDHWFEKPSRRAVARGLLGAFPVRRGGGGSADLMAARAALRAGRAVVVFPEGTRSRDGGLGEFRSGAFRLAAEAGVPVVPVGLTGTGALLPVSGGLRPGPVVVAFGEALPTTGRSLALVAQARDRVAGLSAGPARPRAHHSPRLSRPFRVRLRRPSLRLNVEPRGKT
ncbi:lysophospholipid acyltransferase family protein [Motilibacter deserti]|uniref:lysophospholipid acyltransferase family protein n=1 Tax=Motilibacter deserti TaxID=2714956 RepID=UPI002F2B2A09